MNQVGRAGADRSSGHLASLQPHLRAFVAGGAAWLFPGETAGSRPRTDPPVALGQAGALEVRLAATPSEVRHAQRLRYKVFYEERAALASPSMRLSRRDSDVFDPLCDHLLVLDHSIRSKPFRRPGPKVVGTYRLLRREVAQRHFGFYSAAEFDIAPLLAAQPACNLLELGRSCVLRSHRSKRTVELLWQGLWTYVVRRGIDAMIGCASLEGTDVAKLAPQLGYLHHFAASPEPWRVRALPHRHVAMDAIARDGIDQRLAFKALPPLVKGYLRVGATFGEGAVIDRAFGTTDVFAVMPVRAIQERYVQHFAPSANVLPA